MPCAVGYWLAMYGSWLRTTYPGESSIGRFAAEWSAVSSSRLRNGIN